MQTSQAGIDFIKRWEGFEAEAYQDVAGVWTIGYGHIETTKPGMIIGLQQANDLLAEDLKRYEDAVDRLISAPLTQTQYDVLVSFSYNVGIGALERSTARRRINEGDYRGGAEALTWWNKATVEGVLQVVAGLENRRAAERMLFEQDIDEGVVEQPGVSKEVIEPIDHVIVPAEVSVVSPEGKRPPLLKRLFMRLRKLLAAK